jgi:hypothetical protein
MEFLDYSHAPVVGFYFLGASIFSVCVLRKPQAFLTTRRRTACLLAFTIFASSLVEVLYYMNKLIADPLYKTPHPAVINDLGLILVWGLLSVSLLGNDKG